MKKKLKVIWSNIKKRPVYFVWWLVWILPVLFTGAILCVLVALATLDESELKDTWDRIF